jgi:hypothetical protein
MSCADCFKQGRDLLADMEQVRIKAKEYAKQNNLTTAAIFKKEDGFDFSDPFFAIENHYPIIEVVSVHQYTSAK